MTREEQIANGFTEMMRGFWGNQDLKAPDPSKMTAEEYQSKQLLDELEEWWMKVKDKEVEDDK